MKNISLKLIIFLSLFYSKSLYASTTTNITSSQTTPVAVSDNDHTINITGSGNLSVNTGTYSAPINNSSYTGTAITVNTTSTSNGITATGSGDAISFTGTSSLSSLTVTSGQVTSTSNTATVNLRGAGGTTAITVGQDSGNSGTISSSGVGYAIRSETTSDTSLTIENKATGIIQATEYESNAIALGDSDGGSTLVFNNAGILSAYSADYYALTLSGFSATFTNSGTVTGSLNQNSSDQYFRVINNSGTINGSITLQGSSSSVTLNGGSVVGSIYLGTEGQTIAFNGGTLTGNIIYSGAVSVTADTTNSGDIGYNGGAEASITSLSISANKTLNTTNGSILSTNLTLGSGSTLNVGSGTITTSGDFTVSGATAITAATLTISSGSTLGLTLSDTSSTLITLTGAASLSASTTLNVTLPSTVSSGAVITLLDASDTSSIGTISDSNININSTGGNTYGLNTFSASVSGNKLLLTASAVAAPTLTSSNNQSAYDAIANASASGNLATIQTYLGSSSYSSAQKEEVIKSTTAQTDNSTNRLTFNNISTTSGIISARLESVRNNSYGASIIDSSFAGNLFNQPAAALYNASYNSLNNNGLKSSYPAFITINGNDPAAKSSLWIQTFGSAIAQGNTSAGDGYNATSGGAMVGADHNLSKNFILGLSAGYSKSSISARNSYKSTGIDTYQASIYSGYDAKSFFVNNLLGISVNNYSSNRYISAANASAKASYSGLSYTAQTELGKNYHFSNDILFTPSLTVTAAQNRVNSYDEGGAGSLNLHVKNDSTNFFEGRLGTEISQLITTKKGTQMRPQISASYGYDFAGNRQKSTSNFIGQTSSFASNGSKVAQGSLKLGTGISFYTKKDVTLSANYGLEHRSDYISHSGWFRAGYKF